MIQTSNLNQARKEIQILKKENPKQLIIVQAQNNEFNRKILENKDVDIITDLELHDRKDYQKQRDSGLNEIHCKLAKKNNIKIGINIKNLTKLPPKDKAIVLSRIIQNIKLCKRTKTNIIIYPNTNHPKQDIMSLFTSLGASTTQAKEATKN